MSSGSMNYAIQSLKYNRSLRRKSLSSKKAIKNNLFQSEETLKSKQLSEKMYFKKVGISRSSFLKALWDLLK